MKYACINGEKAIATKNAIGKCCLCGAALRAYCGDIIVDHWKHISMDECDSFYEPETPWHRNWKNNFIDEQQEFVFTDEETKKKHIADIYNDYLNLVIEFQHSPISLAEIKSRESFYKKMIWVVDISLNSKNIAFKENTFDNFHATIIAPWQKNYNQNSDRLKEEKFKNLLENQSEEKYLENLSDKYFKKEIMEGFHNFPVELGDPPMYTTSVKPDLFIMEWKHQHERWNYTEMETFFDIGDENIYLRMEAIPITNGFLVKRYSKKIFVEHYKRVG